MDFKGHYVVLPTWIPIQNFDINNINKVMIITQKYNTHNWINKLFSEENKVPRTLFEARKVAGSAR